MKSNRIMWVLVTLIVFSTIVVTFGTLSSRSQEKSGVLPQATLPGKDTRDLTRYGIVNYDTAELPESQEGKMRRQINQRYDRQNWVFKTITNPRTAGVGKITHDPPPPLFPVDESALIVIGRIIKVDAFLSNDKGSVYSEYTILVDEVLKGINSNLEYSKEVLADREGGVVLYPYGHRVLYQSSERGLPQVGNEYIFFLVKDNLSPNYSILTSYEFDERGVVRQMEMGRPFEEFKHTNKTDFIGAVRMKTRNRNQ